MRKLESSEAIFIALFLIAVSSAIGATWGMRRIRSAVDAFLENV